MTETVGPSGQHMSHFSNPLYFKTATVSFLAAWPIAFMCYVIYIYNIVNYKNMSTTLKMIFFPVLLFPGILDNSYDIITNASVEEYNTTHLAVLIAIFSSMSVVSLMYLGGYMFEALGTNRRGLYRRLPSSDVEMAVFSEEQTVESMGRWQRIIDEYMTANVVWSLTIYNMMLLAIYVARYITHKDGNFIRELDVALLSAFLGGIVAIIAILDLLLFRHPSSGSVFMHYVIAAVFALSFTVDFQGQVKFCELLTLIVFFSSAFLAIYKLWMYKELGVPASRKTD